MYKHDYDPLLLDYDPLLLEGALRLREKEAASFRIPEIVHHYSIAICP